MIDKIKIKEELNKLCLEGYNLAVNEADTPVILEGGQKMEKNRKLFPFSIAYQRWYSKSLSVIKDMLPDRQDDFVLQYKTVKHRTDINEDNYTISDFINRVPVRGWDINKYKKRLEIRLLNQIGMVKSVIDRLDFILADMKEHIKADLINQAARALKAKKYLSIAEESLDELKKLLKNDLVSNFDDTIETIEIILDSSKEKYNKYPLLKARKSSLNDKKGIGTISPIDADVEHRIIMKCFIDFIEDLEKEDLKIHKT